MVNIEMCNNCGSEVEIGELETERNARAIKCGGIYCVGKCVYCEGMETLYDEMSKMDEE